MILATLRSSRLPLADALLSIGTLPREIFARGRVAADRAKRGRHLPEERRGGAANVLAGLAPPCLNFEVMLTLETGRAVRAGAGEMRERAGARQAIRVLRELGARNVYPLSRFIFHRTEYAH